MRQSAWTALRIAGLALLAAAGALAAVESAFPEVPSRPDAASPQQQKPAAVPKVRDGTEDLPRPVLDLRETMLAAIESGRIEELARAYDTSEIKPDIGVPPKSDPVAHWKAASGDGQGREVLAALSLILDAGYV